MKAERKLNIAPQQTSRFSTIPAAGGIPGSRFMRQHQRERRLNAGTHSRFAGLRPFVAMLALPLLLAHQNGFAQCKLGRLAEVPVTMSGLRPTVTARINGTEAVFLLDSGAFYSTLTTASASEFKLRLRPLPPQFHIGGVGGWAQDVSLTTVRT